MFNFVSSFKWLILSPSCQRSPYHTTQQPVLSHLPSSTVTLPYFVLPPIHLHNPAIRLNPSFRESPCTLASTTSCLLLSYSVPSMPATLYPGTHPLTRPLPSLFHPLPATNSEGHKYCLQKPGGQSAFHNSVRSARYQICWYWRELNIIRGIEWSQYI